MNKRAVSSLVFGLFLAACAEGTSTTEVGRRDSAELSLPPMKSFVAAPSVSRSGRSNASIAQDFMDLTFQFESGATLKTFSRIEGPITLRVLGKAPKSLNRDLDRLLKRLSAEAGIYIDKVPADEDAVITIDVRSASEIKSAGGNAACFVHPNVSDWEEYKATKRTSGWNGLEYRDRMAIFLPADRSPQLILECLHEELAQALGPVNDLWRLDDSILNDDNIRTVLTPFDMTILKATYSSELRTGMSRMEVAARLPGILDRINPAGRGGGATSAARTTASWEKNLTAALNRKNPMSKRQSSATKAVEIARKAGWTDNRLAFSLLELGRVSRTKNPKLALQSFLEAGKIYEDRSTTDVHAATVAVEVSAFMLRAGQPEVAINLIDQHTRAARDGQNAELLAMLLMIKAEALDSLGQASEAATVRRESLGWARYGLGSDRAVRQNLARVAALSPEPRTGETE